jgi:hypothetical protein
VIGGGNVAMDCVRTALRIGFEDVNLIYRRTEAEMPADPVEIEEAKEEGVKFHYLVLPVKILARDGRVSGIECIRMELGGTGQIGPPPAHARGGVQLRDRNGCRGSGHRPDLRGGLRAPRRMQHQRLEVHERGRVDLRILQARGFLGEGTA